MRFTKDSVHTPCNCRSVGECQHGIFDEERSLDKLVNAFAKEMKAKLRKKHIEGYVGWDDPALTREMLLASLKDHLVKGDPVDIANLAAIIWNREA